MKSDKIKIAIISHALVIPVFRNRWQRLAEDPKYDVHLIVPEYWEQTWFGEKVVYETAPYNSERFHIVPLPTTSKTNWGKYFFKSLDGSLGRIKPDLIYLIHEEGILIHHQIYLYRRIFCPDAKIVFFSMNARGVPYTRSKNKFKKFIQKALWANVVRSTEAALVHYPGCLTSLREGGYQKPIFLQTQVGVDETLFAPSCKERKAYRSRLSFDSYFVIGYAGRLVKDKGVDDILSVFIEIARTNENIALLLVGNGELREEIEEKGSNAGIANRIHVTGFIDQAEVPKYLNAMDLFVLGSKTMPSWIDTFPLATVQAQAIGLPVVASDSGSLPWQLGDSAVLYPEGNRQQLRLSIEELMNDDFKRQQIAQSGRFRSLDMFCHEGMTENFKKIIKQVLDERYVMHEESESYKQWKAY